MSLRIAFQLVQEVQDILEELRLTLDTSSIEGDHELAEIMEALGAAALRTQSMADSLRTQMKVMGDEPLSQQ
jgi:hypothetical protein